SLRTVPCHVLSLLFLSTAPTPSDTPSLSLHDALPICSRRSSGASSSAWVSVGTEKLCTHTRPASPARRIPSSAAPIASAVQSPRSEEHTSELQSRFDLVCRLLLEKKKKDRNM